MSVPLAHLAPILQGRSLVPEQAAIVRAAWSVRRLRLGERLWNEGEKAQEMGLLCSGELGVQVRGHEIGSILPGDIFGETTVFSSQSAERSATLRARKPCEILVLSVYDIAKLEQRAPVFMEALLDRSLEATAKRIRATDLRIAKLSHGVVPVPEQDASSFRKLVKALRKITIGPPPDVEPLLRRLPNLRLMSEAACQALLEAFEPERYEAGDYLFREGEHGDAAYLLVEGEVNALRHVRNRRAEVLVAFKPGDLFGSLTLVVPGPRTASCIATSDSWAFKMCAEDYHELPGPARVPWRSCMVAGLSLQLRNANTLLARFISGEHKGGPLPEYELESLLKAAGELARTRG